LRHDRDDQADRSGAGTSHHHAPGQGPATRHQHAGQCFCSFGCLAGIAGSDEVAAPVAAHDNAANLRPGEPGSRRSVSWRKSTSFLYHTRHPSSRSVTRLPRLQRCRLDERVGAAAAVTAPITLGEMNVSDTTSLSKLLTFLIAVAIFERWERTRPSRRLDSGYHFRLNLLAFAVVLVAGAMWPKLLVPLFERLDLQAAFTGLAALRSLPSVAKVVLGLVLADFSLYWVHRWMHGPAWLWRAHQFHHSTEQLNWFSGARTSVVHLLLFAIPQVLIAYYLLDVSAVEAAVGFSIGVVVNLWVHTNISVNLGPLEWLIITPDFHRVHHARDILPSKNIGFMLTIWDRLFGTYLDPHALPNDYPLGLSEDQPPVSGRMIAGV